MRLKDCSDQEILDAYLLEGSLVGVLRRLGIPCGGTNSTALKKRLNEVKNCVDSSKPDGLSDELLTIQDAAEVYGCTTPNLYVKIKKSMLPVTYDKGRMLVRRTDVLRLKDARPKKKPGRKPGVKPKRLRERGVGVVPSENCDKMPEVNPGPHVKEGDALPVFTPGELDKFSQMKGKLEVRKTLLGRQISKKSGEISRLQNDLEGLKREYSGVLKLLS